MADERAQETAVHQTQPQATEVHFSRSEAEQADAAQQPQVEQPPPSTESEADRGGESPAEADRIAADQPDPFAEKPLVYVGGAFVGAFVLAQILKRLTGGD
jgi:hypothetical protein